MKKNGVASWRLMHNLPVNLSLKHLQEQKQIMELYQQGYSDREIGDAVGKFPSNISSWRRRRGLPKNVRRNPLGESVLKEIEAERCPHEIYQWNRLMTLIIRGDQLTYGKHRGQVVDWAISELRCG